MRVYGPPCAATLSELKALGAQVVHGVDAGDLAATLPAECRRGGRAAAAGGGGGGKERGHFDRCVWNFPCAARGADGQVLRGAGERAGHGGRDGAAHPEGQARVGLIVAPV